MSGQQFFHMCQKCHQIVEKVYQKGYCKKCLVEYFREYQSILNESHAMKSSHFKNNQIQRS
ncbi:MAG: hypothetical protein OEV78_04880 [Spirochaetia bacterium]|nr:hypothetical protein [Spirochaetia bacterium]